VSLVLDQGNDHAVQVEEEEDEVEAELGEGFLQVVPLVWILRGRTGLWSPYLLVNVELAEDLGGVEEVGVVNDPIVGVSADSSRFG
jgi:hypothetical protein